MRSLIILPSLTSAVDSQGNQTYTINTNDKFKLFGWYFGSKAPSVYLEYEKSGKVAALSLKVDKSSYAFADVKGKEKKQLHGRQDRQQRPRADHAEILAEGLGHDSPAQHRDRQWNRKGRTMPFCISTPSPY